MNVRHHRDFAIFIRHDHNSLIDAVGCSHHSQGKSTSTSNVDLVFTCMDDWQDVAFSNRHVHNRGTRKTHGAKGGQGFNVRRTFGTYELKCPAASKAALSTNEAGRAASLEVYCLSPMGDALIGELHFPGVLHATVLLAGSRKTLNAAVKEAQARPEIEQEVSEEVNAPENRDAAEENSDQHDEEDADADDDDSEAPQISKPAVFEKNTFRSPKFWMKWQGHVLSKPDIDTVITDSGYLIFSGNSCDKFQGTISCELLEWDNVKVQGWKTSSKSERDYNIDWTER